MPTTLAQEAGQDAISDLINRARIAGKNNPVLQNNIETEAGKLGISPSLLIILEQMQKAFEDEAKSLRR